MSDEGTRPVCIPGGEKLLNNTMKTGECLMEDAALAPALDREELILLLEAHAQLGDAMVRAVARTRKKMELGT